MKYPRCVQMCTTSAAFSLHPGREKPKQAIRKSQSSRLLFSKPAVWPTLNLYPEQSEHRQKTALNCEKKYIN